MIDMGVVCFCGFSLSGSHEATVKVFLNQSASISTHQAGRSHKTRTQPLLEFSMRGTFVDAIHSKSKVRLTFYSKKDRNAISRVCAPMDYGPSARGSKSCERFHLWDYDSDVGRHSLSLGIQQVLNIEVMPDKFDPAEFVSWVPSWSIKRDWGDYS